MELVSMLQTEAEDGPDPESSTLRIKSLSSLEHLFGYSRN